MYCLIFLPHYSIRAFDYWPLCASVNLRQWCPLLFSRKCNINSSRSSLLNYSREALWGAIHRVSGSTGPVIGLHMSPAWLYVTWSPFGKTTVPIKLILLSILISPFQCNDPVFHIWHFWVTVMATQPGVINGPNVIFKRHRCKNQLYFKILIPVLVGILSHLNKRFCFNFQQFKNSLHPHLSVTLYLKQK